MAWGYLRILPPLKFTVRVCIHRVFVESPQRPNAGQTSRKASRGDPGQIRGKGVGRGTLGGEERRPGDQTALPPGSLAETESPPAVMPGKRQQVSFPACAEPARTLGTVSCWECVVCPPERKCGTVTGREPICARWVTGLVVLVGCHGQEGALPAISESCPLTQISLSAPTPCLVAPWGPLLPRPRRALLPQHFKGRRSVCSKPPWKPRLHGDGWG